MRVGDPARISYWCGTRSPTLISEISLVLDQLWEKIFPRLVSSPGGHSVRGTSTNSTLLIGPSQSSVSASPLGSIPFVSIASWKKRKKCWFTLYPNDDIPE